MLDIEGSVKTATCRQGRDTAHEQERKVDVVVREGDRYAIEIAALHYIKWLGSNTYNVGKSMLMTVGYPVPPPWEPIQRGEGVVLVFTSPPIIRAWRAAEQQWVAWSSRLNSARLQGVNKKDDHL